MKNLMIAAALATGVGATAVHAEGHAGSVTLQLQWVTQSQFAGYYVAQDMGFYEEEGLTSPSCPAVLILHRHRCLLVAALT